MRECGRIEPGSCGGVRTGHAGFLSPARIATTYEMLSLLWRPGSRAAMASLIAESGAVRADFPVSAAGFVVSAGTGLATAAAGFATVEVTAVSARADSA